MDKMEVVCYVSQRSSTHVAVGPVVPYLTARCRAASAAPPGDGCNPSEPSRDRSSAAEDRRRRLGLNQRASRGAWGQNNTHHFKKGNFE